MIILGVSNFILFEYYYFWFWKRNFQFQLFSLFVDLKYTSSILYTRLIDMYRTYLYVALHRLQIWNFVNYIIMNLWYVTVISCIFFSGSVTMVNKNKQTLLSIMDLLQRRGHMFGIFRVCWTWPSNWFSN